jgi:hypothetical protein
VTPMITGMIEHFMFHIHRIYILKYLYFNLFLGSFCIQFLCDGINKQILSFLKMIVFWYIALCSLAGVDECFRCVYCIQHYHADDRRSAHV